MKGFPLLWWLLMGSCLGTLARAVVLVETDFGTSQRVSVAVQNPERPVRVQGTLPLGWSDNSSWAALQATYARLEEAGRAFTRIQVDRVQEGQCQIAYQQLGPIDPAALYQLTLRYRSSTGAPIHFGIRQHSAPYRFYWERREWTPSEWTTRRFVFRLPEISEPVGLWINFPGTGTWDLESLRLERTTAEALIAARRQERSAPLPSSLTRHTRFPLGLPSGWMLDRNSSDGDVVRIHSDPQQIAPSRAPALRVEAPEPCSLYSEPFSVPILGEPFAARIWVKGSLRGRLHLLADGRILASAPLTADAAEWQPTLVAFEPSLTAEVYTLRFDLEGEGWLDALQVTAQSQLQEEYVPPHPAEVALGLAVGAAAPARIQFDDEPPEIQYAVTGKNEGNRLRIRVENVYGESWELEPVPLEFGFTRYGSVVYLPEGTSAARRPYGAFRVEAWVEDPQGKPLSPIDELVLLRVRRPRYWNQDAPDSPFGVHTNSTRRHLLLAKAIGINWVRLHDAGLEYLGWYYLEPEPGRWEFRDRELKRYRQYRLQILGELGTAPLWASYYQDVGTPHSGYFDRYYQPKRLEDFANYVRTVAARYRGLIAAYDVWNEPWIAAWWAVDYDPSQSGRAGYRTSSQPQRDFVRLMETAYRAVREVDPEALVLGVNTTTARPGSGNLGGSEWTAGVLAHGGLEFCDRVAYHQYTNARVLFPGDAVQEGLETAVGPIRERFGELPKPVWMTEGSSVAGRIGEGLYRRLLPTPSGEDVTDTADRLCRFVVALLANGVEKVFLYSMHTHGHFPGESQWRVLVTSDGMPHPSAAAYAAMAWLLEGTHPAGEPFRMAPEVFAYPFAGSGRTVVVLSPQTPATQYAVPRSPDWTVLDLWGNPLPNGSALKGIIGYLFAENAPVETVRQRLTEAARPPAEGTRTAE